MKSLYYVKLNNNDRKIKSINIFIVYDRIMRLF